MKLKHISCLQKYLIVILAGLHNPKLFSVDYKALGYYKL